MITEILFIKDGEWLIKLIKTFRNRPSAGVKVDHGGHETVALIVAVWRRQVCITYDVIMTSNFNLCF